MAVDYVQDGLKKRTSGSFYRGETANFHPTDGSLVRDDAIPEYVVKGWMPTAPFVTPQTPIVAFGSCFAENISKYLVQKGFNVLSKAENKSYVTQMGDGIVNTFAIRQQFEWAWLGKAPAADLWHGYSAEAYGYDETVRLATKDLFDRADLFVITLGLSEIWYDEPTGEVFWRAVPKESFDATRHKFRVSTVAENRDNLTAIVALIRRFRPEASIVVTLSPIPLAATFRPVSCLSANAVSKAVLRAAIDEAFRALQPTDPRLFYFPSYEVVTTLFNHQWMDDRRHVRSDVLDFNMKIFERWYTTTGLSDAKLNERYRACLVMDRTIGAKLSETPLAIGPKAAEHIAARAAKFAGERVAAEAAQADDRTLATWAADKRAASLERRAAKKAAAGAGSGWAARARRLFGLS